MYKRAKKSINLRTIQQPATTMPVIVMSSKVNFYVKLIPKIVQKVNSSFSTSKMIHECKKVLNNIN